MRVCVRVSQGCRGNAVNFISLPKHEKKNVPLGITTTALWTIAKTAID